MCWHNAIYICECVRTCVRVLVCWWVRVLVHKLHAPEIVVRLNLSAIARATHCAYTYISFGACIFRSDAIKTARMVHFVTLKILIIIVMMPPPPPPPHNHTDRLTRTKKKGQNKTLAHMLLPHQYGDTGAPAGYCVFSLIIV